MYYVGGDTCVVYDGDGSTSMDYRNHIALEYGAKGVVVGAGVGKRLIAMGFTKTNEGILLEFPFYEGYRSVLPAELSRTHPVRRRAWCTCIWHQHARLSLLLPPRFWALLAPPSLLLSRFLTAPYAASLVLLTAPYASLVSSRL